MSIRKPVRFYSVEYLTFDGLHGVSMHESKAKAMKWKKEAEKDDTYEQIFTVDACFLKSTTKKHLIDWFSIGGGPR